jgi:hypothetical protein
MSAVASPELVCRMTKANMGAAAIISDLLILGPHPLFDTCRKLRGLEPEYFIRWADRVSTSIYSDGSQFKRLIRGTIISFEERIADDPSIIGTLTELCEKLEEFLKGYRK